MNTTDIELLFTEAGTIKWSEDYFIRIVRDVFKMDRNNAVELIYNLLGKTMYLSNDNKVVLHREGMYDTKIKKEKYQYFFILVTDTSAVQENKGDNLVK